MLNKIKKIGIFFKKILRPIQTLIILIFFLVGLFLSFFNTHEDIFTLKLYYNSTQQDNTDFSNYLTNEMQNIKGYDEIEAETFLNENKNFDLVSFEQIDNYKFLKKDDSYIVKDKSTNTIQYIEGFKYSKPYDKYEDIVDKSNFDDKFIIKNHLFASFSTIENFKISNVTLYNKDKGTIGFLNYSYKNNNLIKTEKPDFYIYTLFYLFFLFYY